MGRSATVKGQRLNSAKSGQSWLFSTAVVDRLYRLSANIQRKSWMTFHSEWGRDRREDSKLNDQHRAELS